jgi:hypothetical protein
MTGRYVAPAKGLASGGKKGGKPRVIPLVYELPAQRYGPWTPQQTIDFVGTLTDGTKSTFFSFNVLAGANAPTITGGWAKIATVDRPQSLGYTVTQGYDPITMDVPIQFEAVGRSPLRYQVDTAGDIRLWGRSTAEDVESDIQKLHWMAGRGKLFATKADHGVGRAATNDPPLVTVASLDAKGSETDLIPRDVQGINWLISSIAYDTSPDGQQLNSSMSRVRQIATVSLTEFSAAPESTYDSPTTRAKGRNSQTDGYQTVKSTAGWWCIRLLVEHHTNKRTTKAFRTVLDFNRSHGHSYRSYNQYLKLGSVVLIPTNLAD